MLSRLRQGLRSKLAQSVLSYDERSLLSFLRRHGIAPGDTLMVHASWMPDNGFHGTPAQFNGALKQAVSREGLLVMPSMTYQNQSTAEFLASGKPVDMRRSMSRMGILSEVFRRDADVLRSLSAAHPLAAWGRDAAAFLQGHQRTPHSFGPESPFARLLARNGKIVAIDSSFSTITFTHFLEHELLGETLYEPELRTGVVIDQDGAEIRVPTKVISAGANAARREARLVAALDASGAIRRSRLGRTRFLFVTGRAMKQCVDRMVAAGQSFFEFSPGARPGPSQPGNGDRHQDRSCRAD